MKPVITDAASTSTIEDSRTIAAQYTRLVALRQTVNSALRPRDGIAAVAVRAVSLTNLEPYRGCSARTHARCFAYPFSFVRLAVVTL